MSKVDEIAQMLTDTVDILTEALVYSRIVDKEETVAYLTNTRDGCVEMLKCPSLVEYNGVKKIYKGALVIKADTIKFTAWVDENMVVQE